LAEAAIVKVLFGQVTELQARVKTLTKGIQWGFVAIAILLIWFRY